MTKTITQPKIISKPKIATDLHLKYLDKLRDSGEINMFGAGPYLRDRFDMTIFAS